ncbi:hypothetical protein E4O71_03455 [Neisseria meningitidis]|nr:hypothetical protein [Neisseria meningitidis]
MNIKCRLKPEIGFQTAFCLSFQKEAASTYPHYFCPFGAVRDLCKIPKSPKFPKFPPRHLGDFGEFCKGLGLSVPVCA